MTKRLVVIVACLWELTACGNSSAPAVSAPTAPTPSPSLSAVTISAPTLVQPGQMVQFSAIATFSDRTTRDVTAAAAWQTTAAGVFTVTASGLVTALSAGEGVIRLSYQGRSAGVNVVSLPAGTGILMGTVKESTFPIGGATVTIVSGASTGRSTVSDVSGTYRLYGVVGDLQLRATKDGYAPVTQSVTVAAFSTPRRDQSLNFSLSANQSLILSGSYRVSFTAASMCSGKLPADVMTRNYLATVTQDGSQLTVVLSGADFAKNAGGATTNSFIGRARLDSADFAMGSIGGYYYYYYYYYSWGFVEHLIRPPVGAWGFAQTTYLAVAGRATGPATTSTISLTLNGTVAVFEAAGAFSGNRKQLNSCYAANHALVLTRQ